MASKRRPGVAGSKPSAALARAKKSPQTRRQRGSPARRAPSGSRPWPARSALFHLNSAGSDIESWGTANFGAGVFTAGVAYGAWIGAIAAIGVAFGAVRHYMAAKAT